MFLLNWLNWFDNDKCKKLLIYGRIECNASSKLPMRKTSTVWPANFNILSSISLYYSVYLLPGRVIPSMCSVSGYQSFNNDKKFLLHHMLLFYCYFLLKFALPNKYFVVSVVRTTCAVLVWMKVHVLLGVWDGQSPYWVTGCSQFFSH